MAHGIRHVRTPQGAAFFDLPIGAPITEHLYQLKKAEHAGHMPKGLTTTKSSMVQAPHSGTPKAQHASLKGTGTFKVNSGEFHAPAGSKVINVKNQPGMKFIRTPDGTVHAFNDSGEIDIPDNVQNALQKKFAGDFAGDEKYGIEDLAEHATPDEAKPDLKDLKVGTKLQDTEGNTAFTKQDDGDWKHEALGIDVSDADIQDDYESGDLSVQSKEENAKANSKVNGHDFKNMTAAETKDVLDADPTGTKYDIPASDGSSMTLEKQKDGTWNATTGDTSVTSIESTPLSYLHDSLIDHKETDEDQPNVPSAKEPATPEPKAPSTPDGVLNGLKPGEKAHVEHTDGSSDTYTKQDDGSLLGTKGLVPQSQSVNGVLSKTKGAKKHTLGEVEKNHKAMAESGKAQEELKKAHAETPKVPEAPKESQGYSKVTEKPLTQTITAKDLEEGDTHVFPYYDGLGGKTWQKVKVASIEHKKNSVLINNDYSKNLDTKIEIEKKVEAPKVPEAPKEEPKVEAPKVPETPKEEVVPEASIADKVSGPLTEQDVANLKPGDSFYSHNTSGKFTLNEDGSLQYRAVFDPDGPGIVSSSTQSSISASIASDSAKFWKAKEKTELPKPENTVKGFKVGDVAPEALTEWYDQAPVGTKISVPDEDGAPEFQKLDSGAWKEIGDSSTPFTWTSSEFSDLGFSPKIEELPEPEGGERGVDLASPDNPSLPKVGEHVLDVETANNLPTGTALEYTKKDGSTSAYAKLENGSFLTPGGGQISADAMKYSFKNKKLKVKSYPNAISPTQAAEAPGHTQLGTSSNVYSEKDMQEALDALEAHSGFQINYGLKAVPDNPLAKNQAELKQSAMSEFPDLKPKAAVVAYLKKKLGKDPELENLKKAIYDDSPKVTIHAGDEKHDVTANELQKGIDILESYNGKLFKNELNKNGSPLGKVDWNKAVGFHKDKTEGKQAVIDLLKSKLDKANKLNNASPESGGPEEPNGELADWEKALLEPDVDWSTAKSVGNDLDPDNAWIADPTPEEKEASALATNNDLAIDPDKPLSHEEFGALPIGSVVYRDTATGIYTKVDENIWKSNTSDTEYADWLFDAALDNKQVHLISKPNDLPDYAKTPVAVQAKEPDVDSPDADIPAYNKSGLLPGKYSTKHGKAYMIVKSDGSGIYVNGSGEVSKKSPGQVKANHKAGMDQYLGVVPEDEVPKIDDVSVQSVKKDKKKPDVPVNLEDGTYFSGTIKDPKANTYEVKGDHVTITKADGSVTETTKSKLKTIFANGKILDSNGNSVLPENHTGSMYMWNIPTTGQGVADASEWLKIESAKDTFPGIFSDHFKTQLAKHGIPLSNFNFQDQILKKYGNFENAIEALGPKVSHTAKYNYVPPGLDKDSDQYKLAHHPWNEEALKVVQDQLDEFTKHIDTSHPEGGATGAFEWTTDGAAKMPLEAFQAVNSYTYYDNSSVTKAYNDVKKSFGDGKTIGQVSLGKYDKNKWLNKFQAGDFAGMYDLEVAAAAAKGKVLPNGYKHPGYTGNTETHKVNWAAAVEGESPVGTDFDHEWSQVSPSSWSPEEIDNYLIKAQMQNPTYLSAFDKGQWAGFHMYGNKKQTDLLSVKAMIAKQNGSAELTPTPVWSDSVKPAKSYNSAFTAAQNPEHPTAADWLNVDGNAAQDWVNDNLDNASFNAWLQSPEAQKWISDNTYSVYWSGADTTDPSTWKGNAYPSLVMSTVAQYHQEEWDAWHTEAIKPHIKHTSTIEAGEHTVYIDEDTNPDSSTFGKKFVFKPGKQYLVEQDVAANKLGKMWGYAAPNAEVVMSHPETGEVGFQQEFADKVGDLTKGHNTSLLGDLQLNDLAKEHVLDWMLDNDDSHGENLMVMSDGHLVGIDKSRSFRAYGQWKGLDPASMNTNTSVVYSDMYKRLENKQLSKEQADGMYVAAIKAAKRIQRSDDSRVASIIQAGVAHRTSWAKDDYMSWGSTASAPKNADDLVSSVLARKEHLVEDFDGLWKKIYDGNGWDLPEIPSKALGDDHLSGWDEADTVEKMKASKTFGAPAIHSSGSIVGGHSLLWAEKDENGNDLHFGQLQVGKIASDDILSHLTAKTGGQPLLPKSVEHFPNTSEWKGSLTQAGKEVTKNVTSVDSEWDPAIAQNFNATKAEIAGDAEHWSPDLTTEDDGFFHFPSGNLVPADGLFQYKQALDHYGDLVGQVEQAKASNEPTDKHKFTSFNPVAYANNPKQFYQGDKWYKQLSNGGYLYYDGQSTKIVGSLPDDVSTGWESNDIPDTDPNTYSVGPAHLNAGTFKDGVLTHSGDLHNGSKGTEYTVGLPTGEQIRFRDHDYTDTVLTQHGMINFKLNSELDEASSLSNVQKYIESLGVDMSGVDETSAELNYWRQMFHRVHASAGGSSKATAARAKLEEKLQEAKTKLNKPDLSFENTPEAISKLMSENEELKFYHDLADQTWGKDKVDEFLGSDSHLPQYQHNDLSDTEKATGHAWYKRIDVTKEDLEKHGSFVAFGSSGGDSVARYMGTGSAISIEERLRLLGTYKVTGQGTQDQTRGGGNTIFMRVAQDSAEHSGALVGKHRLFFNPAVMSHVGTYAWHTDHFGDHSYLQEDNELDVLSYLKKSKSSDNEVMVPGGVSFFDYLEIMTIENPDLRNEVIQQFKALGINNLRGLPIEDRIVLPSQLQAAKDKAKELWAKK